MTSASLEATMKALEWALPLAEIAIESHCVGRLKTGPTDISGTYKSGMTYVGIYQSKVYQIENAREVLRAAKAALDELSAKDGFHLSRDLVKDIVYFIKEWGDRGVGWHNNKAAYDMIQKLQTETGKGLGTYNNEL